MTNGRGRAIRRLKRVSQTRGARGRGGEAGRIGHLYCLKSWSDSLKPLLSSMLMPARASSASCRGAAAAESPSSRRRGRCCSEPAMGARGSAQGRGEVEWRPLRPPRAPRARLYLPEAQLSRAARRGGAGRGGAYSQRADAFSSNAVGAADAARLRLSGFSRLCCFRSVGARPVVWSGPLRGSRLNGGGRGPWGLPASGPREGTVSLACAFDFCFMFVESFPPAALVLF